MPNPPPPAPPPPLPVPTSSLSAPPLPPLTKFPLHTPANASSPLITCSSSTGPLPNQTLLNLRTVLVSSRFSASSRVQLKEDNKRLLNERQVIEKRTAEEAGRVKEGERKRKREEEEKREKERLEKLERERLEAKQREERETAIKKQQEQEESERKKMAWEKEQAAKLQQQQIQLQAQQQQQQQQQQQMQAQKQASKSAAKSQAGQNGDTQMKDATVQPPLQVPSSPEPEEDMLQPKPPRHHDKKKKRKRDAVIDSDDSGTESTPAPEQPLLQKIRKLESTTSHQPSPASVSTPATPGPVTPSARNSPLPTPIARNNTLPSLEANGTPRLNPIERRLKQERFTKHSIPIKPPAPGSATAFYVPTYSLVPVKPEVVPPVPTAKRQADVEGDFSNAKPGQQIAHSTFINWTESYLRPFGEDDLAFLAAKPEDMTPYIIPPLGKPYQQRWEEEDFDHPPQASSSAQAAQQQVARQRALQQQRMLSNAQNPLQPPPLPRLKPCHLSEEAMATENIFLGPLSERLMSALAFEEGVKLGLRGGAEDEEAISRGGEQDDDAQVDADGEDENEDGAGGGGTAGEKGDMDAYDLEERVKRELRFIGLLPEEEVDWTSREDDEISTALRACQRLLQQQVELNEARKAILMSIVKDRMAYQEYETARDAQERVIEAGWHKRQRTDSKKKKKGTQKEKDRGINKVPAGVEEDPSKVPISPVLMEAVEKRNALVESFKPFFEEDGGKSRWWGIPETSVYEGMLEGIEEEDEEQQEVG